MSILKNFKLIINDKLSEDFYQRISVIILLFAGLLIYINLNSGIGIYGGFFHITSISQILELFLLIIGSIILISWPTQKEIIEEISVPNYAISNNLLQNNNNNNSKSFLYNLV